MSKGIRRLQKTIDLPASPEAVFDFHNDPANLVRISPPGLHVAVIGTVGSPGVGYRVRLRTRQFGVLRQELLIEFTAYDRPSRLADMQLKGPFKLWRQDRRIEPITGGSRLTDIVEYELPFGVFGRIADRLAVTRIVEQMFAHRHQMLRKLLAGGN